ncbi:MAG: hypothetical protein GY953_05345, partial [bacterium]|nr:hypothetical protein [bacterium]
MSSSRVVLMIAALVQVVACGPPEPPPEGWFRSPVGDFTIDLPKHWELRQSTHRNTLMKAGYQQSSINVNVQRTRGPETDSTDLSDPRIVELLERCIAAVHEEFSAAVILESGRRQLFGKPGWFLKYQVTLETGGGTVVATFLTVQTLHRRHVFTVTAVAPDSELAASAPVFRQAIGTLRFGE